MDEYTVVGMLYTAFQTALLSCIRYWLYQDNLRAPAKRMYLFSFAVSVGGTLLWVLSGGFLCLSFSLFRILLAATMYGVSCGIIREPLAKHTYTYSFIMAYDSALEISASYLQAKLLPGARGAVFALTAALLLAATFLPAVRYLKRMIVRLTASGNDRLWGWLCVISFSFLLMNLLFTYPPAAIPSLRELFSRYLMLLGIAGLYVATTRAVETMREAAEAKAALGLIQDRVELQERYYARLVSQMDEVRRMRHDLRHHRAALSSFVQEGDLTALAEYIGAANVAEDVVAVTGNLAADSILLYYADAARQLGTRFETEIAIAGKLPVSDPDLCVILGNLLENAVDAQQYVEPENRYIRVTATSTFTCLTLAIDNRFDGTLRKDASGAYLSRKDGGGHGLGIGSVRVLCEKYNGVLQIETDGTLFMAGVVIGV